MCRTMLSKPCKKPNKFHLFKGTVSHEKYRYLILSYDMNASDLNNGAQFFILLYSVINGELWTNTNWHA